jgi:hypothetical protein
MTTTIKANTTLLRGPNGRLLKENQLSRETQQSRETLAITTAVRFTDQTGQESPLETPAAQRAQKSVLNKLAAEDEALAASVNQKNIDTLELNSRIGDALARISGEQLPNSPGSWWGWWLQYNERESMSDSDKPSRTKSLVRQADYYIPKQLRSNGPPRLRTYSPRPPSTGRTVAAAPPARPRNNGNRNPPVRSRSCLVAGTLVQTELGLRPVEQIQAGDLVLAQDVTTGELSYQPVVETTKRPPTDILTIYAGTHAIKATGGHAFWVLGKGWLRTRQLEAGMRLAGVHGSVFVDDVADEGEEEAAYNLVVEDAHTYFVGPMRVLSHDNNMCRATTTVVPGLAGP